MMKQQMYKLKPLDRLFFKGASPSDAGINFHTSTIFPPYPSTYAGMFRELWNVDARELSIGWSGILLNNKPIYPAPLDTMLVAEHSNGEESLQLVLLQLKRDPSNNLPFPYVLTAPPTRQVESEERKRLKRKAGSWNGLDQKTFSDYVRATGEALALTTFNESITFEQQTGISVDLADGVTETGKWYTRESVVLNEQVPLGGAPKQKEEQLLLGVEVTKGFKKQSPVIVKIGGDQRRAKLSKYDKKQVQKAEGTNYFKLYLATPAIWKHGTLPRWIDPATLTGTFSYKKRKIRVEAIAAAIGKPEVIGSFNPKENRPVAPQLAVPAGSVIYFKLLEGTFEDAVYLMHEKNMSDYRERLGYDYPWYKRTTYCDRGFGHSYVAALSAEQVQQLQKEKGEKYD
ncbi:hypothetical protein IRY55_03645 [Savagea sp. SN6]|uniref:Uncharacterized protein n=1 Tax=Savagea serpentis TaxID=2785297 RepID=A0A8J7G780_9BACL|nr:type III-B CRISPR module-associated Cmr3 family protein [Savagea serpentis]MBF4500448.1 hypothetical protein [Savagea serpentis]